MEPVERIFAAKAEAWSSGISEVREMILANLVMTCQIPARAFEESKRAAFVLDRLIECNVPDPYIDDMGNVVGVIPGKNSSKKILLTAHMDSVFDDNSDHNVSITTERAEGVGIADNALGLSVLMTLPDIFKQLQLEFESDIILLATAASKEKGDLAGIRHYINRYHEEIDFNINIEGITLGQVDHNALSRVRCDITCSVDSSSVNNSWKAIGQNSAILMLSDVLDSLLSIPLPHKPKTIMNIGKINGGKSYSRICEKASLSLEVRSEDDYITDKVIEDIKDNCRDVGAKYGAEMGINFFSRHHAAGIKHSHPMVKTTCTILSKLGVQLKVGLSNSEIAVPLHHGIPSVTIGISTGAEDREGLFKSFIDIDPIPKGLMQILILIQNIDEGHCDEQR
jgi:acetylornithine deacetylase/succinyl-diaminopimelate desuccinylase-like protein